MNEVRFYDGEQNHKECIFTTIKNLLKYMGSISHAPACNNCYEDRIMLTI